MITMRRSTYPMTKQILAHPMLDLEIPSLSQRDLKTDLFLKRDSKLNYILFPIWRRMQAVSYALSSVGIENYDCV